MIIEWAFMAFTYEVPNSKVVISPSQPSAIVLHEAVPEAPMMLKIGEESSASSPAIEEKTIYFSQGKTIPLNTFESDLNATATVVGHASLEGTNRFNDAISLKRAIRVKNMLIKKGIEVTDLQAKGSSECTEKPKNYKKCRKVEIKLTPTP
jgi:hypothetical protein